jgi:hypothetical protein
LNIVVIAIVLGLVISAACIGIPQLVRKRNQQPDDDSRGYLKQTGRSAADIARENAAVLAEEENVGRSGPASGAGGPPVEDDAGARGQRP